MNKVIIIAGPTAVGKTDIAIAVAKHFNTQIISADSRQCFKELNIGVAKPSPAQLSDVHHYFINSHSVTENISAADYEQYAPDAAATIFKQNSIAVMCGGTGLYIKAFCDGLDEIPAIDPAIKEDISKQFQTGGIEWLQQTLQQEDLLFASAGEMQNPHRMLRALEVIRSTGRSILAHQTKTKKQRDFEIIKICLDLPREILYDRINRRVDIMMEEGLEAEAKSLVPYKHLNALQTVGYRELFDYFDGSISLEKAVELIKQNSRHYAKRQMTWFKKDPEMKVLNAEGGEVLEYLKGSGV